MIGKMAKAVKSATNSAGRALPNNTGLPGWAKGAIVIGSLALIAYLIYKAERRSKTKKDEKGGKDEIKKVENLISSVQATGKKATLTQYEMSTVANKIYTALNGVGSDEAAVYRAFAQVKNDLDVLGVVKAFGLRDGETLGQWLTGDLDAKEIKALNDMLAKKGIVYRF